MEPVNKDGHQLKSMIQVLWSNSQCMAVVNYISYSYEQHKLQKTAVQLYIQIVVALIMYSCNVCNCAAFPQPSHGYMWMNCRMLSPQPSMCSSTYGLCSTFCNSISKGAHLTLPIACKSLFNRACNTITQVKGMFPQKHVTDVCSTTQIHNGMAIVCVMAHGLIACVCMQPGSACNIQ